MDDEDVASVELEQQVLPAPLDTVDLGAFELGDELLLRLPADRARAGHLHGLHPLADDLALEAAADRLDLRKLRQCRPPSGPGRRRARGAALPTRRGRPPLRLVSLSAPRRSRARSRRCEPPRRTAWRDRDLRRGLCTGAVPVSDGRPALAAP